MRDRFGPSASQPRSGGFGALAGLAGLPGLSPLPALAALPGTVARLRAAGTDLVRLDALDAWPAHDP